MSVDHVLPQSPNGFTTNPQLKRKRDEKETRSARIAVDIISLKPTGSTTSSNCRKFAPICLLLRAQLPLAWLDPAGDGVQMLAGAVALLERKEKEAANVLVAKDTVSKRYWAIERAGHQSYALCRLASTTERRVLEKRATVRYEVADKENAIPPTAPAATVGLPHKRQHLLTPPPYSSSPAIETMELPELPALQPPVVACPSPKQQDVNDPQIDTNHQTLCLQDVLQDLCKHYLEALYLSRTSIAYFVKGPLSRARNAISDTPDSTLHTSGLTTFLREMLLSISASDKRMKDGLPAIVKELTERPEIEGEHVKPPSKTKWKPKRDRAGFLGDEKHHVEQWWQHADQNSPEESIATSLAAHIHHKLQYLRNRETFLQIILLLETMALESTIQVDTPVTATTETQASLGESQGNTQTGKKRSKRPLDLQTHLENLLDRLTIWHSLDFKSPQKGKDSTNAEPETHDELRSFCIEVVVPFYMQRLPKVAALVNKKLGGPSAPTPSKRAVTGRPGEPAQRRPPTEKKSRRSLHRVATDSNMQAGRMPPTLSRSATDSQLQDSVRIKRESSVSSSLHSIPLARSNSQRQRLNSLASLSRREIDLTAVSAATEGKLRKKAEQEARVREAVASIRRPDRALALKESAAEVDAKFAKSITGLKRMQSGSSVHIAASPNTARIVAATPRKASTSYGLADASSAYLAPPGLANVSVVPQTGHRPRMVDYNFTSPSCQRYERQALAPVESPAVQRSSRIDCTPSRPRAVFSLTETPLASSKSSIDLVGVRGAPTPLGKNPNVVITTPAVEASLDDIMGWNDEAYEELA